MDHDHNFWKYNNYICYLWQKNKEELTGQEGKVWDLYNKRSTQWIPQSSTQEKDEMEKTENEMQQRFVELDTKISESVTLMKAIQEQLNTIEKVLPKPSDSKVEEELVLT